MNDLDTLRKKLNRLAYMHRGGNWRKHSRDAEIESAATEALWLLRKVGWQLDRIDKALGGLKP